MLTFIPMLSVYTLTSPFYLNINSIIPMLSIFTLSSPCYLYIHHHPHVIYIYTIIPMLSIFTLLSPCYLYPIWRINLSPAIDISYNSPQHIICNYNTKITSFFDHFFVALTFVQVQMCGWRGQLSSCCSSNF